MKRPDINLDFLRKLDPFRKKSERIVGVKIGHSNIAAIEVEKTPGNFCILKSEVQPILTGKTELATQLKNIFLQTGFSQTKINTAISGTDVIVRFLQYPFMPKKDLRNSLEYEAEKYIPFNISDVTLDFSILSEKKDPGRRFYSLALVAAKRDTVVKLHEAFKGAELELNAVDVDPFASANLFRHGDTNNEIRTVALVNMGSEVTNITILHEGKPVFTRDLVFGGGDITKKMAKRLGITTEEAGILKHQLDAANPDTRDMLKDCLHYLIEEIQLSFQFFSSQVAKGESPQKIFLLGGSSGLKGLPEILKEQDQVETEILNPFQGFTFINQAESEKAMAFAGSLAVPLGLTLRS